MGANSSVGTLMRGGGFSLLELMVVLGLMALWGMALSLALKSGNSTSMRAAESQVGRFVQAVRMQAVLKKTPARLILLDDPDDEARHLRWYGLISGDPELPDEWLAANDGFLLPEGIQLIPGPGTGVMLLDFPRLRMREDGAGRSWYYIEFDRSGRLKEGVGLTLRRDTLAEPSSHSDGGLWIYPSGLTVFKEGSSQ